MKDMLNKLLDKLNVCSGNLDLDFLALADSQLGYSNIFRSLLRQVINLLITGKVPAALAPYLAGGNLTALMKLKELGWDVRPIAVGEVLRRLAGKCACAEKATDFFCSFSIWCSLSWRNREDHTQAQANS